MRIAVPYHLDERLPDLPVDPDAVMELPEAAGAGWEPIAALAGRVASAVEEATGRPAMVCMGDCTTGLGVLAGRPAGAGPHTAPRRPGPARRCS